MASTFATALVTGDSPSERVSQVWSLSHLDSTDFSQSRIGVKNAFSTNAQSRLASVVLDSVKGPPRLARTVTLFLCIPGSNVRVEVYP